MTRDPLLESEKRSPRVPVLHPNCASVSHVLRYNSQVITQIGESQIAVNKKKSTPNFKKKWTFFTPRHFLRVRIWR